MPNYTVANNVIKITGALTPDEMQFITGLASTGLQTKTAKAKQKPKRKRNGKPNKYKVKPKSIGIRF